MGEVHPTLDGSIAAHAFVPSVKPLSARVVHVRGRAGATRLAVTVQPDGICARLFRGQLGVEGALSYATSGLDPTADAVLVLHDDTFDRRLPVVVTAMADPAIANRPPAAPSIAAPGHTQVGQAITVDVVSGLDPDGDQVRVECAPPIVALHRRD